MILNNKIGYREASALTVIFSICPLLMFIIDKTYNISGSFSIVNFVVCFLVSCISVYSIKLYEKIFNKKSILDAAYTTLPKYMYVFFAIFSVCIIFLYTCVVFSRFNNVIELGSEKFKNEDIALFMCLASAVCAYMGIESLTRSSYVFIIIMFCLILIMGIITFGAWDTENLYPIYGTNAIDGIFNFHSLSTFGGLFVSLFLVGNFKNESDCTRLVKRTLITVFVIGITLFVIYIFTVPYPMGNLYSNSLEAVLSSFSKGNIFHRYEIILLFLIILINIISCSAGLYICSIILCKLTSFRDNRPFIAAVSVILYYFNKVKINIVLYESICMFMFFSVLILPIIFAYCQKNER